MSSTSERRVPAVDWVSSVAALKDAGFDYFDWLGCVDEIGRADELAIVLRLLNLTAGGAVLVTTRVPRSAPVLASLRTVFAGATWHEREAAELFGVEFAGGDRRRLLLSPEYEGTPLRKDEVLAARSTLGWPGAKEPGESVAAPSRRRMVPPGVPDPAVWGDRDPASGPADPTEVAASAVGGRVRRRTR
ncbi:hypothetical protein GCM10009841_09480 [Microlunatus panaciterrae]|uniref:NADH-quinone oxidoreductase subunit C n=1 Tax=Microlunatus panaciterrae TaxID=400768 RepID=A0ABS2RKG1_9ACTN|nr:NADH-quinone oxidoreductase subunit C [Microlunatus panaciterrae]MBM7799494.1 NADH-quinone oxidoreductase subunit C [Microlunatus panaciterrae]